MRTQGMLQKPAILILSGFLFVSVLVAKDWKEKSSSEWTETNLWEILMDSAWVSQTSSDFPGSAIRGSKLPDRTHLGLVVNSLRYPMIRFLTAKPIRDAQAMRTIFMNPRISHVISIQDLTEEFRQDDNEAGQARLQRFAKDNPDDIRVIGDPDYIVVTITMTQVTHCNFGLVRQEVTFPIAELEDIQLSELAANTFLSVGEKGRIPISRYQPPQRDRLGAKIFFPRFLLNGKPSVAVEDKELRFETWIQGKKISGKFNLMEMVYKDKLEI
jgi:hypothetical protein